MWRGILSEPLARLGAKVTGVDENEKAIKVAINHAKKNKLNIKYKKINFNQINLNEKFDVILCMEVLEHVENVEMLISKVKNFLNLKANLSDLQLTKLLILIY